MFILRLTSGKIANILCREMVVAEHDDDSRFSTGNRINAITAYAHQGNMG